MYICSSNAPVSQASTRNFKNVGPHATFTLTHCGKIICTFPPLILVFSSLGNGCKKVKFVLPCMEAAETYCPMFSCSCSVTCKKKKKKQVHIFSFFDKVYSHNWSMIRKRNGLQLACVTVAYAEQHFMPRLGLTNERWFNM